MRIAYINGAPFGTIGTTASYRIITEVARKHDIIILAPQSQENEQPIVFHNSELQVEDVFHNNPKLQISRVFNCIQDFKPDIIHLFNHRKAFRYPFYLRHLLPGIKWILDIRSPLLGKKKRSEKIKRHNTPLSFFIDAISTHSKASVKTHMPNFFKRVFEIPPGVDLGSYQPKIPDVNRVKPKRFVFIGSLSPLRKIDFLITNFVDISNESKERIHLDIFGGGPSEINLKKLVESMNCEDIIRIAGVLPQDELPKRLSSYDAGIAYVPNGPHETAPSLKSLEFAASGIPVFVSDTLGHRDYAGRGFKFEFFKNNSKSFRETIQKSINEGVAIDSVCNNLNKIKEFNWATMVQERLFPLYERLLR